MHDFIQHLSFNSPAPFAAARAMAEPMRGIVRSFNEVPAPAFRPGPRPGVRKSKIRHRKSKIPS